MLAQYPAFRGLLGFAAALCWALVAWMVFVAVVHTAAALGRRTVMYGRQRPTSEWSKHFYPACFLLVIFLLALGFWLRGFAL